MSQHSARARKIDPARRPDGTPADNDRAEIGPTPLAFDEWAAAGLEPPNLDRMRRDRHARLVRGVNDRGYAGALLFDPLNIRYATDSTNMQVWNTHNQFRACFVGADGYMVLFDFKHNGGSMLSDFNPLVREVRSGAAMTYFMNGDLAGRDAREFAGQINELMAAHGPGRKLAVDKVMPAGFKALANVGIEAVEGEELTEKARSVKSAEEIRAMRCAMHSTELTCAEMERAAAPGMTEVDVWAVMHAGNIRRGGEWIECRLMTSGPRTNPWFQECGPRILGDGDILAYDTDLVGPYGMCADISRTVWVGAGEPTPEMKRLFRVAREHIRENTTMLRPGMSFKEVTFGGHMLDDEFVANRYCTKMHGVGLCDEWPMIRYPQDWRAGESDYFLEPGMAFCVEALIALEGGGFSIKLEDQVLITEDGVENLTNHPFDERFLN